MEERMKKVEERLHRGDLAIQRIEGKMNDLIDLLTEYCCANKELHKKMFIDNGSPCFQTRLDRMDRFLRIVGTISMAAATVAVANLVKTLIG